jgi:hypothetical protein
MPFNRDALSLSRRACHANHVNIGIETGNHTL